MRWLYLFSIVLVFSFNAGAITIPSPSSPYSCLSDTTLIRYKIAAAPPAKEKKGLFRRLEEKLTTLLTKHNQPNQATTAQKQKLTLVALVLILLGVGVILLTNSLLPVALALAGIIIGVKAVRMKRQTDTAQASKKAHNLSEPQIKSWFRRNLGWIIPVGLVLGGLVALALAWGNARFG